jgi:bifunctional non-homologous end joining protein LigD
LKDIASAGAWTIDDAATLIERAGGKALKGWGFANQALPGV